MVDLRITGADQLKALAARYTAAGRGDLRNELHAAFRAEARPVIADLRTSARTTLPHRGGLAERIAASKIRSNTRTTGSGVGMRIVADNKIGVRNLNAGNLRHPLFGNRRFWYGQNVRAGWFDDPIRKDIDDLRRRIIAAMDRIAAKLGGT